MNLEKMIHRYANNENSIARGYTYYRNHYVHDLVISDLNRLHEIWDEKPVNSPDYFLVKAAVQNDIGSSYHVSLIIKQDEIASMHCQCPAFGAGGRLCKHLIALLHALAEELQLADPDIPAKPPAGVRLADQLLSQYQPPLRELSEAISSGKAQLLPKAHFNKYDSTFSLEFTVGISRPYVLKSLHQFADRFLRHEILRYGKDLVLLHDRASFTLDSQFYLDLILEINHLLDILADNSSYYFSKSTVLGRNMTLSPNQFDAFFDYVCGQTIPVSVHELLMEDFQFQVGTPDLKFSFQTVGTDYYQPYCNQEECYIYRSNHFSYLICNQTIYRVDDAFGQYAFPLLEALQQAQDKILFDKNQMSTFIGLVYPHLQAVDIDAALLEALTPAALEAKLYFDYPYSETVRGRIVFQYGSTAINPLHRAPTDQDVTFRNQAAEYEILSILQKYHFSINEDEYMLLGEESIFDFLTQGLTELLPLGQIMVEDRLEKMKSKKPFRLAMDVTMTKGIIEIKFDDSKFSHAELATIIKAYQKGKKYVILKDNTFLDIVNPSAKLLNDLLTSFDLTTKDLSKAVLKAPAYRALYLNELLEQTPEVMVTKNRPYKDMIRDILEPLDTDFEVPANLQAELRQYQRAGFYWLKTLSSYGFGGILADDMGLGKTLQAIALLLSEAETATRPSIIVAPTSLIYNWQAELDKFAPDLHYRIINGNAAERKAKLVDVAPGELLITSYDTLKRDIELYDELEFDFCIADEAQYIKNHYTQNAQAIKALASRIRFALTGTPMENSLADLWSIMDFILPGYLLRWQKFKGIYEIPITRYENTERLHHLRRQVAPFLLRRIKKEVLQELPDKIETTLYAELSEEESKIYHAQLAQSQKEFIEEISSQGIERSQIKILALLTRLRQACCSPSLFLDHYEQTSSKLSLCLDLIEEKREAGSQMLLFSQFTSMLDLIAAELEQRQISYLMLTGATKGEARMNMVNLFNKGEVPVFLISLKAGGVGLNLVAADTVIHYDPWWNLSAQNQATDRAHRIGQDKKVHVIKLIAKDTIEEKIEILQSKKKELTDAVITEGQTFLNKLGRSELEALFSLQNYAD